MNAEHNTERIEARVKIVRNIIYLSPKPQGFIGGAFGKSGLGQQLRRTDPSIFSYHSASKRPSQWESWLQVIERHIDQ
jgi:hypothetical protein